MTLHHQDRTEHLRFHRAIRSAGFHSKVQALINESPPLDDACALLTGVIGTHFPYDAKESLLVHMVRGGLKWAQRLPEGHDGRQIAFLAGMVANGDGLFRKIAVASYGPEEFRWVPLIENWQAFENRFDITSIRFENSPWEDLPMLPCVSMLASRIAPVKVAARVIQAFLNAS